MALYTAETAAMALEPDDCVKQVMRKDEEVLQPSSGGVAGPAAESPISLVENSTSLAEDPSHLSTGTGEYPYRPLLSENHIRLLLLEPLAPGSTQDSQPICATLHHVEFDSESLNTRPYKALSYEWVVRKRKHRGIMNVVRRKQRRKQDESEPSVQKTILLDGHTVHIGENLYNALKSMRYLDIRASGSSSLWLWVDALCINQSDVQERGHQVRLMKRIYKTAEMVLVWLGTGDEETFAAMKVLNLEADEFKSRLSGDELTTDELCGTQKICTMGYWQRVWILQEIVLARNYLVICGINYVPMEKFQNAMTVLCKDFYFSALLRLENPAQEIIRWRSSKRTASPLIKWLAMCMICGFGATDPRDYVYALLGISDDCEGNIEPDYSRSVREVYTSAIALVMKKAEGYQEYFCGRFALFMGMDMSVGPQVWEEVCGREVEEEVIPKK